MVVVLKATYHFNLPISVTLPRKRKQDKKVMLNMNVYRNLHYQVSNQVKQAFEPVYSEPFKAKEIRVSYTVLRSSRRRYDTMNIVSIVDKLFLDWLVNNKMIPDDTCDNVYYGNISGFRNAGEDIVKAAIEIKE